MNSETMNSDETEIRGLIARWIEAVQRRDLDGVLADHTADIVMFDVPPPDEGLRGLAAYRDSWAPFFEFLAGGARFELLELDVAAGDTVAYAHALLRCGCADDLAAHPDRRLRLTLGLRKPAGRWLISHEHHSFPMLD